VRGPEIRCFQHDQNSIEQMLEDARAVSEACLGAAIASSKTIS
jgi:hypothetical protein